MRTSQDVCKNIQFASDLRMINPTASDLEFDFSLLQESICINCLSRPVCKVASLLNVPVKNCRYFAKRPVP